MEDGISIRIERTLGVQILHAEGDLSLSTAGQMKSALLELVNIGEPAVIDLAGITGIDLSGLQLLCSAHRTFRWRHTDFELRERSGQLQRAASDAGYAMRSSVCPYRRDQNCLWK